MRYVSVALLALFVAGPASAQQLALDIRDGLVTLEAVDAPVRLVLAEWARIGGTRVVGAERITAPPLTLRLERVPEARALEIVLRSVAGYMAATRSAPGGGRSNHELILVLASSTPPAGGDPPAVGQAGMPAPNRFATPPESVDTSDPSNMDLDPAAAPELPNPFANYKNLDPTAAPALPKHLDPAAAPELPNLFGQPVSSPFGKPPAPVPRGGATGVLFGTEGAVPG